MPSGFSEILRCRGCHSDELDTVLQMAPMPLAGMFCDSADEAVAAPVFPLTWIQCACCGLTQVLEDISDAALFTRYNYASSSVPGLVRHFKAYAEHLKGHYQPNSALKLLEIGCNDGILLKELPSTWVLTGCDPSDVASAAAKTATNYELISKPFSIDVVEAKGLEEQFDVLTASNCLAHISDLKGAFAAASRALRPGGHFWIEVHDLEALLKGSQWDTIYHEHKVEWSEASLIRCVSEAGFEHSETQRTAMHGGALRVRFTKTPKSNVFQKINRPVQESLERLRLAYEARHDTPAARKLTEAQSRGYCIAAYGASGRGNVYLNQMSHLRFEYIIDEAPLRLNKFLPRVGTPVVTPVHLLERPPRKCLITAWNYKEDIVRKNASYSGEWLTAFAPE
jgi:SAM-dependent methyltransferase